MTIGEKLPDILSKKLWVIFDHYVYSVDQAGTLIADCGGDNRKPILDGVDILNLNSGTMKHRIDKNRTLIVQRGDIFR